jgi:GrpB-like predicted nucleotidyltransferase (UPF0157 family)
MLTASQKNWIEHLSDTDKIVIKPYDPTASQKFRIVKEKIQKLLGKNVSVKHCGATHLKISGQDEIDVYVPAFVKDFDKLTIQLKKLFGEPGSTYPLEKTRFKTFVDNKRVDVFLINKEWSGWTNCVKFEKYLKTHPKILTEYRLLKESGNGLSVREYYKRKLNFLNKIFVKF